MANGNIQLCQGGKKVNSAGLALILKHLLVKFISDAPFSVIVLRIIDGN